MKKETDDKSLILPLVLNLTIFLSFKRKEKEKEKLEENSFIFPPF